MTDRESVITHLQIISTWASFAIERDLQFFTAKHLEDIAQWLDDALALLKEQSAVEPYMDYDGHDVWRCGNCGATIFHIEHSHADEDWKSYAKYCRKCGKKVKWE